MKKLKEILKLKYDLPPMRVWHFLGIFILVFGLGLCAKKSCAKTNNKAMFFAKGYDWIEKAECGPFEPPCCHADKNDPGGFTCNGMSIKSRADVFAECIGEAYKKPQGLAGKNKDNLVYYSLDRDFNVVKNNVRQCFKRNYYKLYFKKFNTCPFKVALQITDSNILSGQGVRLFQRSQGLTQDNIWGPKTQKACQSNPNMKAFKKERKSRFMRLKTCKHHCKGWFKRLDNLDDFIKKI